MTDAWNTAANECGSYIEGAHVKFNSKLGEYLADGRPLVDNPKAIFIMTTAKIGSVVWTDGRPVIDAKLVEDGGSWTPDEGADPYTEIIVSLEGEHRLMGTFTASSWAVRKAFRPLVKSFARSRVYPVCALGVSSDLDRNDNHLPVFTIVGHVNPEEFPEYGPVSIAPPTAPAQIAAPVPKLITTSELINDDIPF